MSEPFLGEIKLFGPNFAPRNWALCDGQILSIAQFSALFSLLGTMYGGDGRTTFGLPDLRSRVPVHAGMGPGLSPVLLGEKGGAENAALQEANLPSHSHNFNLPCNSEDGESDEPADNFLAKAGGGEAIYHSAEDSTMGQGTTDAAGNGNAFSIMPPFQGVYFIIALQGIYPSRN